MEISLICPSVDNTTPNENITQGLDTGTRRAQFNKSLVS